MTWHRTVQTAGAAAVLGAIALVSGSLLVPAVAAVWFAAGMLALRRPTGRATGTLMIVAAVAWLLPLLASADSAIAVTGGLLLRYLYVAVVAHLLLAFPDGRLGSARALALAGYVLAVGVQGLRLLVTPAADLHGCDDCVEQLLLVDSWGAEGLRVIQALGGIALVAGVIGVLVQRQRRLSGPRRRVRAPVLGAGALLATLVAALLGASLLGRPDAKALLAAALLAAFAAVPCAFLAGIVREHVRRAGAYRALALRLERPLGHSGLRSALAEALGDPGVRLAYALPGGERYVDEAGAPFALPGRGGWTAITRAGRPIAAIVHDPALEDDAEHVRAVGATAALALENEQLGAELRARLVELSDSRARLATAAEQERRRIARDLHDGAQRRLAGLALELGMAVEDASPELRATLVRARSQAVEAQRELRALAHGIHPAALTEQGLAVALRLLVDELPLAASYDGPSRIDADPVCESALYFVAAEALANVLKHAGASAVTVRVRARGDAVELEIGDDGVGGATFGSGLLGLQDRVRALGGELSLANGRGTILTARVPCVR